mgnify:CR=1 FL=1
MSDEDALEFVKGLTNTDRRFEDQWLAKFSRVLEEAVGNETRKRVLHGSNELLADIDQRKTIDWTREAMNRLDAPVDENQCRRIMAGCVSHFLD